MRNFKKIFACISTVESHARYSKLLLSFLICLCFVGCASIRPTPTAPTETKETISWETRKAQLETIQAWDVKGSTSIQYQNNTDIASLNWKQRKQNYTIVLSGPLNFGRVEIAGAPGAVTFKQGSKIASASSPEALMTQQLGWQIPVSNLYYWLRGIPAPGSTANTQFDRSGRIAHMTQQGWSIEYAEYTRIGKVDLPRKIYLNNPSLNIRIVIRQWSL